MVNVSPDVAVDLLNERVTVPELPEHTPLLHDCPVPQVPQLPPHPLSPQTFPAQFGVQMPQFTSFLTQLLQELQTPLEHILDCVPAQLPTVQD